MGEDDTVTITRLILVRHAEATAARGDPALSETGWNQTEQLAERIRTSGEFRNVTRIVTSPLQRARDTATRLAQAFSPPLLAVEVDPNLREMEWGDAEGLSWEELVSTYGEPLGREHPVAPGAESWAAFEARARSALRSCALDGTGMTMLLVCHTGVIEASFIEFGQLTRRGLRLFMAPRNAGLTSWVTAGEGPHNHWRLEAYNDAAHLWASGVWSHATEDFDSLRMGREPFWDAIEHDG